MIALAHLAGVVVAAFAGLASPAAAEPFCDRLFVPSGWVLECRKTVAEGRTREEAVVTPARGAGAELARLTVRELDRESDPVAFEDPSAWLESRLAVDVGGLAAGLRDLTDDPTSPLGSPTVRAAAEGLVATLEGWGRFALAGCTPSPETPARHELRCRWGLGGVEALMTQRLVVEGERRYAVAWRATDAQSSRHLEAIANSFGDETPTKLP